MVDRVRAGDNLYTIGASGFFIVPEHIDRYRQVVFMAAGSGITPVYALIKTILHRQLPIDILLIYSNTATTYSIFFRELKQLAENSRGRFQAEFLFSRSVDAHKSRLTPETLELFMRKHAVTVAGNSLFFICGPSSYMRMLTYTLTTLGADQNRIKKEIFHVQHPTVRPKPPDTEPHTVTLIRNSEEKKFIAEYPVTILQAARLVNIHIPYSCETGQCGTCVAKCLQGKVWMAQNEVLLDEEMQKGSILTCTGYPVEGDVTIEIQ
jgi:ring-1,2-phenylacetyl-CoA epoxidase subunit PaaE